MMVDIGATGDGQGDGHERETAGCVWICGKAYRCLSEGKKAAKICLKYGTRSNRGSPGLSLPKLSGGIKKEKIFENNSPKLRNSVYLNNLETQCSQEVVEIGNVSKTKPKTKLTCNIVGYENANLMPNLELN
jgi:hypothetical protein